MLTTIPLIIFIISWGILRVFGIQLGIESMIALGFAALLALAVRDYLEAGEIKEGIDTLEEVADQLTEANQLIAQTVKAIDTVGDKRYDYTIPIIQMRNYLDNLKELPHV